MDGRTHWQTNGYWSWNNYLDFAILVPFDPEYEIRHKLFNSNIFSLDQQNHMVVVKLLQQKKNMISSPTLMVSKKIHHFYQCLTISLTIWKKKEALNKFKPSMSQHYKFVLTTGEKSQKVSFAPVKHFSYPLSISSKFFILSLYT